MSKSFITPFIIAVVLTLAIVGVLFVSQNKNQISFGVPASEVNGTAVASTTHTSLVVFDGSISYFGVVNTGSNTVYLQSGATSTAGKGIAITANGGSFEIDDTSIGSWVNSGTLYQVTASGTSSVSYIKRGN